MSAFRRQPGPISLALGFGVLLAGCPKPPAVSLSQTPRRYTERDYDAKLEQWTRSSRLVLFQGADARLAVDATFLSADFRSAYVARFAHDATLSQAEREQNLAAAIDRTRQEHEFFVALETQSIRWGDLTRALSAWRVRLIDDRGREVAPIRIEAVRRITAPDREYFPYITPWRQAFRIHFPRRVVIDGVETEMLGAGTRYFLLRFGGALGTADLRWDVAESG